jgi:hypothetical protein
MVRRLVADVGGRFPGHDIAIGHAVPHAPSRSSTDWIVGTAWDFNRGRWAESHTVSDGYFDALGMRILRGRAPGPGDVRGSPLVAVVNETFERDFGSGKAAGLLVVGLVACWVPAHRASRLDPARVLRAE